jgi:23S rRNA (uracil1939-C5)-methyltransferase
MIRIERLGARGDAIVTHAGGVIHADRFLPGDEVAVRDGKVELVAPSPNRVAPFCPHFESCGGCKFQHWNECHYRRWKRDRVVEALRGVGIETDVRELIDAHGTGRRRATLHVRKGNEAWGAGFMSPKSHDLCALDQCPILAPALRDAALIAASFGPILGPCDVSFTACANGLDVSVKAERKAVERRTAGLAEILSRWQLARLSVNGEIFAAAHAPVLQMGLATVAVPPGAFLQATELGEMVLARTVLELLPKARHVADLFCGIGTFALRLGERARVTAFDSDKPAIEALQNAVKTTQGLKPIPALVRNLFNAPVTSQELKDFDAIVLDPPRAGAEAQCKIIAKSKSERVVYVSCDVQSFARDAKLLCDAGFTLKSVQPVDQFKWSAHVELVSLFER